MTREETKRRFKSWCQGHIGNNASDEDCQMFNNIMALLDQEPKTGHWIYGIDEDTGEKDLYAWTCSECEGKYPWQPKYCPNCGAKMESEE